MAALLLGLLLAVGLPVAALLAVAFLVYRRRSSPRNAPPELPEVAPAAAGPEPTASPGLAKLNMRYSAASGRVGLRFQQLHQHQHHARVDVRHRGPGGGGGAQQGAFQWADHPRLVTEAAENGWAQFVFPVAPPRSKSASSSPLWDYEVSFFILWIMKLQELHLSDVCYAAVYFKDFTEHDCFILKFSDNQMLKKPLLLMILLCSAIMIPPLSF